MLPFYKTLSTFSRSSICQLLTLAAIGRFNMQKFFMWLQIKILVQESG